MMQERKDVKNRKIWILLILSLLLMSIALLGGVAEATVIPGGQISTDTTWTVAEGPYLIEGDLTILSGVTLNIEPGTEIRFVYVNSEAGETNRAELMVHGRIQAVGSIDHPIRFSAETDTAEMGSWGGIYLYENNSQLSHVQVERAITGLTIHKGATVEWSKINNNLQTGIQVAATANVSLTGNEFTYNRVGLFLSGNGTIQENRFMSNNYGLLMQGVINQFLGSNSFESNTYGIYLEQVGTGNEIRNSSISGNDYGIYMESGSSPVVNYCDIYNNLINFQHFGTEDVQAAFNWWGTSQEADIDELIVDQKDNTSTMTYGYVLYNPFLEASALEPTVLDVKTNPAAIGAGVLTVTVTFSKEMNRIIEPTISYGLFDPYTTHSVDPAAGQWLNSLEYRFTINVAATMEEGLYRFNIRDGESFDGQLLKSNITYTFLVDRTPPTVFTGVDYFAFSPNGDGRMDQLEAPLYFDEMATYTYSIYQGTNLVYGPIVSSGFSNETVINWDGQSNEALLIEEGNYELQIHLEDQAGNVTSTPVVIPILADCTQPILELNSLTGIQTGNPDISGRVEDQTTPTTYLAYRLMGESQWTDMTQLEGNQDGLLYTWNILNLDEGAYELQARTVDLADNESTLVVTVNLDTQAPQVTITEPLPDQHLLGEGVFSAEIQDYFLQSWQLEFEVDGVWIPLASGTADIQGEIHSLDLTSYADGAYRYRVRALDQVGHETNKVQTLHVDNHTPPVITGLGVSPEQFSPNGDGQKDETRIQVNFSEVTHWQMDFLDQGGQLLRSYQGTGLLATVFWDGLGADGSVCADGIYTYQVTYQDQVGHVGIPRSGEITIDTEPPQLTVESWPAVTSQPSMVLAGTVADYEELKIDEQIVVPENGQFSTVRELTEGLNQITVIAEDQAGNQSLVLVETILDSLLPIIHFEEVKELTNQDQSRITGWIEEMNLIKSQVTLINGAGEHKLELNLTADQAFDLKTTLVEGENRFIFSAVDAAGNLVEEVVIVRFLPTIAEIGLYQPAVPYLPSGTGQVILQVYKGTVDIDPQTISVQVAGKEVVSTWDESTEQITFQVEGLAEGAHRLKANVDNSLGEAGAGLDLDLIVDLTDPIVQVTSPVKGAVLDGWNGESRVIGRLEDKYLKSVSVYLKSTTGQGNQIDFIDLTGQTFYEGDLATLQVAELANGSYTLEVMVEDLAGRKKTQSIDLQIHNTGRLIGQIQGDLDQIYEPVLYLVVGNQIMEEFPFDPTTGEFDQRVSVGNYDLVLMPWGYDPVLLPDIEVAVGKTYSGLEMTFEARLVLEIQGDKQLLALPVQMSTVPDGGAGLIFESYDGAEYQPITDWTQLEPGVGYWITGSQSLTLDLDGQPVPKEEVQISLQKGWNLISTPYNYPYPLEGIRFVLAGKVYQIAQGQQAGLIDGGLWDFRDWYREVDELEPWVGYWIYLNKEGVAIFSPDQAITPYRWETDQSVEIQSGDLIQDPEWQVQIRAVIGQAKDMENHIGTSYAATENLDPGLDYREPPGYAPYVSLYFSEPGEEKLTRSYQPPVQGLRGERSWEMVVESDLSGWVKLSWELAPDAILSMELTDETTGETIYMLGQTSYEFFYQKGQQRKFIVTAKKGEFEIKKVFNYPNPFSPDLAHTGGKGKGTRIRYLLTHDADVKLEVLDVMGRLVKGFPEAAAGTLGGEEGWNQIYWDGFNGHGKAVANGTYILKVTATKGKNRQVEMIRMAVINRR